MCCGKIIWRDGDAGCHLNEISGVKVESYAGIYAEQVNIWSF